MTMINGVEVYVAPDQAKLRIRLDVPCSDQFRADMDDWLRSMFGVRNICPDGQIITTRDPFTGRKAIYCNPRTYAAIKAATIRSV